MDPNSTTSVATSVQGHPSIVNLLKCKCPRCRQGDMFTSSNPYKLRTFMKMNEHCPVCEQLFDIEPGFYYGTSFISYAFAVLLSVASFVTWWLVLGFSLHDNRVFFWMIFNAFLLLAAQPPLMRLARTIWLAFFVRYNPDWSTQPPAEAERFNPSQKDAW